MKRGGEQKEEENEKTWGREMGVTNRGWQWEIKNQAEKVSDFTEDVL